MARTDWKVDIETAPDLPHVRHITPADLKLALQKGWDDFAAMPTFAIFLVVIYPIIGILLFKFTFGHNMLPLAFPLIAGFALIGPLAAIGLYEMSRRREQGLDVSLSALNVLRRPAIGSILALGMVLLAIFFLWLSTALHIYGAVFGSTASPPTVSEFTRQVLYTPEGRTLMLVGCGVGFLFALASFTISVVSFPLLLDRNVGAVAAVLTSIKAVFANPVTLGLWGLIVTAALVLGALPGFIGLIVVLPVLGHATWHLYRRLVVT